MITAYKYKLRPNKAQAQQFDEWLELLRRQYNYRLGQRFDWYESTRCPVNSCSLVSCSIAPIIEQLDYYWQKRDLLNTKQLFPEYKQIHSQVLQDCIARVKKAVDRYIGADKAGKRSGKPRFKGRGRYHSFTYTQMSQDCTKGNRITLSKIGDVKIILHRPIPDGFKIKTAQIVKNADGYYVVLTLQDVMVPTISPDLNLDNAVGIDMGLKDFLITSNTEIVPIPQFARKAEIDKKLRNKAVSRKKKGSNRRRKAVNPNGTTQNCSNCGTRIPKTIADRWHSCHVCGLELDRDVNAAINIKNIAVGRTVIKAQRVTELIGGVAEKPALYA
jgi:putative transposase